jgi:hypothetical protein
LTCLGDIMVALKLSASSLSVESAIRKMHPFPIFERYVDHDISLDGKTVDIKANTQVEMFVPDFAESSYNWPIFGAGDRACAGKHLAIPFLRVLGSELRSSANFQPHINHRLSGRNNDTNLTFSEIFYFVTKIIAVLFGQLFQGENSSKSSKK